MSLACCCALLVLQSAGDPGAKPASAGQTAPAVPRGGAAPAGATDPAQDADARARRWEELLAIDLPAEVLAEGLADVGRGGALAADGRAVALVARALVSAGRPAEARVLLEAAAGARPQEHVLAERARLALEEDDLERALALLTGPDGAVREGCTPACWWIAGRAHARLGAWARAETALAKHVELAPWSAEAASSWHLLAQAALARGDGARAQQCAGRQEALGRWHAFHRARLIQVRENPREPLPRFGLAQLWLEAGDWARARAAAEDLVRVAPEFARGWMALGEAQRRAGDLERARASYDRALELDPALDVARFNRAVIARLQARPADARRDLELLVAGAAGEDPKFAGAHLELARLLRDAGEAAAAAAAYARYQRFGGKEPL